MDDRYLVSVIVTTKNEEKNIGNCLESIKAQTYLQDKMEIIVVDNSSTDKTKEIARKYTDNPSRNSFAPVDSSTSTGQAFHGVKVYNWGPERSAQRNFGIRQAKGKYVLYSDEDMVLFENVIFEL